MAGRHGRHMDSGGQQPTNSQVSAAGPERPRARLRHTFVSVLSDDGMPIEQISQLAGHSETATTETVYLHQIRPVILHGAEAMDRIFPAAGDRQSPS